MIHLCHAVACKKEISPRLFVCPKHWRKLHKVFQDAIWREYKTGQEVSKTPTNRYIAVQRGAISLLATIDGYTQEAEMSRAHCDLWRTFCREQNGGGDPFTSEMEMVLYGKLTGMLNR